MVSLSLVLMVWILGSMLVVSLCAAAARGDDQLDSYRPTELLIDAPDATSERMRAPVWASPEVTVGDGEPSTSKRQANVAA